MEDTLRERELSQQHLCCLVLILVLMEDTLRGVEALKSIVENKS